MATFNPLETPPPTPVGGLNVPPIAPSPTAGPPVVGGRTGGGRVVKPRHLEPERPNRRKKIWLRVGGGVLLLLLALGLWFGSTIIQDMAKIFGKNGNSLLGLLSDTKLKGEDRGRVNILLAGDSADDPGHGGANLTDSIIILSINTQDHSAFTLSIPRDLWVSVPGHGYQKINAANSEGGMSLLEQTLENDLGIPIDYYALVNYTAFRDAVNAVGGIDVTIQSSDPRGLYDANITKADGGPLRLKNGPQHLDGQTALNLARARGDSLKPSYGFPRSDFDRTDHQRMMLAALASKAMSTGVLANPLRVTQLMDAIGSNVQTDFQTSEIRSLVNLVKGVNLSGVQSLSFVDNDVNLLADYTAPDGESTLIPKAGLGEFGPIQAYMRKITSNDPVVKEGATVVVLNGSGQSGLAKSKADALTAKGMVTMAANAPAPQPTTTLIDNSAGKLPATKAALGQLFGTNVVTNAALTRAYPSADFIVVLGADEASGAKAGTDSSGR